MYWSVLFNQGHFHMPLISILYFLPVLRLLLRHKPEEKRKSSSLWLFWDIESKSIVTISNFRREERSIINTKFIKHVNNRCFHFISRLFLMIFIMSRFRSSNFVLYYFTWDFNKLEFRPLKNVHSKINLSILWIFTSKMGGPAEGSYTEASIMSSTKK